MSSAVVNGATGGELRRYADALQGVIERGSPLNRRLRRIEGSVTFKNGQGFGVTLVADPTTLEVRDTGDSDVTITFNRGARDAFGVGALSLTTAILDGHAVAEGRGLRRFLAVAPILRGLLAQSGDAEAPAVALERDGASPDAASLADETWSVEVQRVHKSFGSHQVLAGVDLRLPEGAVTVILGPSGTGKSVMLKHLIGLLAPDQGEVVVHGRRLSRMSVPDLLDLRRRYGVLFQDGALFGSMNVFDNVAFPLRQHTDLTEPQIERIVNRRLDEVGLLGAADRAPGQLSGGMRKRVGFARALVLDPDIVLFDEPDSGLDPVRTSLLSDLVLEMHPRYGGTYVVITHNIQVARKLGEYLAVLYQGQILAAGTRDAIFNSSDPFVRQFLAGDAHGPLGMD